MLITRMVSLTPGRPGRRQQIPRTMRSIGTPACEACVERGDDVGIDQRVHLGDDPRRAARR